MKKFLTKEMILASLLSLGCLVGCDNTSTSNSVNNSNDSTTD